MVQATDAVEVSRKHAADFRDAALAALEPLPALSLP